MKQYCRYCNNLENFCDNYYCYVKERHLALNTVKTTNKCKDFSYNPIDALNIDKSYKPRKPQNTRSDYERKNI